MMAWRIRAVVLGLLAVSFLCSDVFSFDLKVMTKEEREEKKLQESEEFNLNFAWWPTDATPGPVKDEKRGGYWWWPKNPGTSGGRLWGNRGYVYVKKIIFDYKEDELPPPQRNELRPSLLIRKEISNVKIYFDYDKATLRQDHFPILKKAVQALKKNPGADILITGNCDKRGSNEYNQKLGKLRGQAVRDYMAEQGIPEKHIRIISRGKLDAVSPITDIVGLQKDRNAQFMVAEVEEAMLPYNGPVREPDAIALEDGGYLIEKDTTVESRVIVSTKKYVVRENDTLKKIAQEQLGAAHRWQFLYEYNKGSIEDPEALKAGTTIIIPIEQEAQKKTARDEGAVEIPRPKPAPKEPATTDVVMYEIKKNDSLSKIAKEHLGDGNRWQELYELNKSVIKDPNKLMLGTKIKIPAK